MEDKRRVKHFAAFFSLSCKGAPLGVLYVSILRLLQAENIYINKSELACLQKKNRKRVLVLKKKNPSRLYRYTKKEGESADHRRSRPQSRKRIQENDTTYFQGGRRLGCTGGAASWDWRAEVCARARLLVGGRASSACWLAVRDGRALFSKRAVVGRWLNKGDRDQPAPLLSAACGWPRIEERQKIKKKN